MIGRHHVVALLAGATLASACVTVAGCNALTGIDRYVADCRDEACSSERDADAGTSDDGGTSGADGSFDGTDAPTTTHDAAPTCAARTGRLDVHVDPSSSSAVVESNPSGLSVAAGSSGSACLAIGSISLRVSAGSANWRGTSCRRGNDTVDRCEFELTETGASVAVTLQN
ncbi:MAG: hypothetical protein U0169_12235 [Polyangiaceae bacterium]